MLQHALTTLEQLTLGADAARVSDWERTVWRDLIAMFMWTPNPRSGPGPATAPVSVPILDSRAEGCSVSIGYSQLWFRQAAADWPAAIRAHAHPLQQVVFGDDMEVDADGGMERADGDSGPDDADARPDDAVELGRMRTEEKAAEALRRAHRRATQQLAQVMRPSRASTCRLNRAGSTAWG